MLMLALIVVGVNLGAALAFGVGADVGVFPVIGAAVMTDVGVGV